MPDGPLLAELQAIANEIRRVRLASAPSSAELVPASRRKIAKKPQFWAACKNAWKTSKTVA
jgi:hypothetical protein